MDYLVELLDIPCTTGTTIGENVRYFMYKYKIVYNDWFNDLSHIFNRIDNQIQLITPLDDICLAGAIRELCEARDSGVVQLAYITS